jgi:plasmid stability protein
MPRTTIRIDDDLLRRMKEKAAREQRSLQEIANRLLRQALAFREKPADYKLRIDGWKADPQPGVDILDRRTLFDVMNGR